jgi:hypothetical protein
MSKRCKIKPEFVELVPENVRGGILYISISYSTAIHKCACGCGQIVVTPIKPRFWEMTWNGEEVSLYPSVGNWNFQCKSHYIIRRNRIIWLRGKSKNDELGIDF